jgi:hypothetical protein
MASTMETLASQPLDRATTTCRIRSHGTYNMRLVFISDTHNYHNAIAVPDSDALIFCGDATATAFRQEVLELGA